MTLFSGEARNRIVAATSSTLGQAAWLALGIAARFVGVSMMEGATALTRMPSLATSSESATGQRRHGCLARRVRNHAGTAPPLERMPRSDIDETAFL